MSEVVQLVSTVGFPAAMCLILLYYMFKREEEHGKEMAELKKAINNNTLAVNRLSERIKNGGADNG